MRCTSACAAAWWVSRGKPYIATHPDFNCPVKGGFIPDIGGVIALVEACTGRRPDVIIGKPNGEIAAAAAARFGLPLGDVCMVGDRLYTDIRMAVDSGILRGLDLAVRPLAGDRPGRRIALAWRRTSGRKETFQRLAEALRAEMTRKDG